MPIRDAQLNRLNTWIDSVRANFSEFKLGVADVIALLGAVEDDGESGPLNPQLAAALNAPGITRAQQLDLVRKGLTPSETEDLRTLLVLGGLTPAVAKALEQLLGKRPVDANEPPLCVLGNTVSQDVYRSWEFTADSYKDWFVTEAFVMDLLKALAVPLNGDSATVEEDLAKGLPRHKLVSIITRRLDELALMDLVAIRDRGPVRMDPEAKLLLDQVLGREPVCDQDGKLVVDSSESDGTITGTAAPDATVEAINLSHGTHDTFVLAKTDRCGVFTGTMPGFKDGDLIRLRATDQQGHAGNWLTVRAGNLQQDTFNAEVQVDRIVPGWADGKACFSNTEPVSEPEAWIAFVNIRTGDRGMWQLDAEGNLPADAHLNGIPGDTFSVRASDGFNNLDMAQEVGVVELPPATGPVDLPDPPMHASHLDASGQPTVPKRRFTGPLFVDGAAPSDVDQGSLPDCYLAAAAAALAHCQPKVLPQVIKDLGNGLYSVDFFRWDDGTDSWRKDVITVDADLHAKEGDARPYYGRGASLRGQGMEMWWPILEKAYAQWKGGYDSIGHGGFPSDVFVAVLGRPAAFCMMMDGEQAVWDMLKNACDANLPACASTHDETQEALYTNTGVHSDHAYTVMAVKEEDGVRSVKLRNPWGNSEPSGDGTDDGEFWMPFSMFTQLFAAVFASQ